MKLLCTDANMPQLVHALWLDEVPALLMERTGTGFRVEFLRPGPCPHVLALIAEGVVSRG